MQSEMGGLVVRHGGVPLAAPVLEEVYAADAPEVGGLIEELCGGRVDVLALQTGVGTRALLGAAEALGRGEELVGVLGGGRVLVLARSPKPAAVLRRYGLRADLMAGEPFATEDLLRATEGVDFSGLVVAVQAYGGPNGLLARGLGERGALVREVSLYRWGLPGDRSGALELVRRLEAGGVDAVAFTSRPQVGNLLRIAGEAGLEGVVRGCLGTDALGSVVVGSVGPVCSRELRELGLRVDVEPLHPYMGSLVVALAERLGGDDGDGAGPPG